MLTALRCVRFYMYIWDRSHVIALVTFLHSIMCKTILSLDAMFLYLIAFDPEGYSH